MHCGEQYLAYGSLQLLMHLLVVIYNSATAQEAKVCKHIIFEYEIEMQSRTPTCSYSYLHLCNNPAVGISDDALKSKGIS